MVHQPAKPHRSTSMRLSPHLARPSTTCHSFRQPSNKVPPTPAHGSDCSPSGWKNLRDQADNFHKLQLLFEESPDNYTDSLFTELTALAELHQKITFLEMLPYDDTSDPMDHVDASKHQLFIVAVPWKSREACMCRGFGSSLNDTTLRWYTSLSNDSVSSFAQLVDIRRLVPLPRGGERAPCRIMLSASMRRCPSSTVISSPPFEEACSYSRTSTRS